MNHDRKHHDSTYEDPSHARMTDVDEREWLAQERALRDERTRGQTSEDQAVATYRHVVRALRAPLPDALPADFARSVAAQCRRAPTRVDTWLEQQFQQLLLAALAVAAVLACANYGGEWLRASLAALPVLDQRTTLDWSLALAACLCVSWATGAAGRRLPIR
jgi:hypothetical protein